MNARESTLQDPYVQAFPETQAFWLACTEGKLLIPRCTACGKTHWHPRPFCPFCHADALEWITATGRGEVYTFSVIRHPPHPYVLAYVRLAEGPLLMTNVVDCDPDSVSIGMQLTVGFRPTEQGRVAPIFRPVDDGAQAVNDLSASGFPS